MSLLASLFVARRYRWMLYAAIWAVLFVGFVGIGVAILLSQVGDQVRRDRQSALALVGETHQNVFASLQQLNETPNSGRCSQEVLLAMQRVAFLPDGLNKFLYAPGGVVRCSTDQGKFAAPIDLGDPDIKATAESDLRLWIHRSLNDLSPIIPVGTIAAYGDFAVVVPPRTSFRRDATWLDKEMVIASPDERVWNVAGTKGLYRSVASNSVPDTVSKWFGLTGITCDAKSHHCVASRVRLAALAHDWNPIFALIVVVAAIVAWLGASYIVEGLSRYWSFAARFSRHIEHVVCFYQPIIDLRSGRVAGCEVLARWRDLDGKIVAPDQFLGIIESENRTAEFTKLIVDRAYEELSARAPSSDRLQVNFNIFGCDLDGELLLPILAPFNQRPRLFDVAVELLECQSIDLEQGLQAIQELKAAGVKVYIDDFGIGYSNIERAATLAVDGVKLDRSFAMAPEHSILERLLIQILSMLKIPGGTVVVEGVETQARLDLLRETGNVDFVQGYVISRPLPIEEFAAFVRKYGQLPAPAEAKRAATG